MIWTLIVGRGRKWILCLEPGDVRRLLSPLLALLCFLILNSDSDNIFYIAFKWGTVPVALLWLSSQHVPFRKVAQACRGLLHSERWRTRSFPRHEVRRFGSFVQRRGEFLPARVKCSMNVLICTESHYVQVGDEVYCPLLSPDYFQRYREVWEEVVVLGRSSRCVPSATRGTSARVGRYSHWSALPDYTGPLQYLHCRRRIRLSFAMCCRRSTASSCAVDIKSARLCIHSCAELAGHMALKWWAIHTIRWPAIRHPVRCGLCCVVDSCAFCSGLCRDAYASAYVTAESLQRRYPPQARYVYDPLFRCGHQSRWLRRGNHFRCAVRFD